jgi:lysophospholipase L1-like esterase
MRRSRVVALLVAVGVLVSSTPAAAAKLPDYLALGDSVAFGFDPLVPPEGRFTPSNFVGYPEALASSLPFALTNGSCPGEASGGFISVASALDNGCRPYRAHFPLHVNYPTSQSQLDFAIAFLRQHRQTKLITISIGANDVFILQRACAGDILCIQANLPALLGQVRENLSTIYARLRHEGHFRGRLVALTYYALDYTDAAQVAVIGALNGVVSGVTLAQRAGRVADGFGAFAAASGPSGSPCVAGLLIRLTSLVCDVHPSPAGREVLALAIRSILAEDAAEDVGEDVGKD